ncbi:MAG TPA: sigma factor-like helix-turn-helix DNA-binding protein [Verrucomicrobiae bacterium]|nr:sigma factor-like helix-turn-helix DNA-binding protein [Verrucomicrobiae bacterium]
MLPVDHSIRPENCRTCPPERKSNMRPKHYAVSGVNLTFKEIGQQLGVSEQRVDQIFRGALAKLRVQPPEVLARLHDLGEALLSARAERMGPDLLIGLADDEANSV